MPSMPDPDALVAELRRTPLAGAPALIRALGLGSQPTFSRLVARAGDRVVAVGRARARRYAAARDVRGLGREVPLFRVDEAGRLGRIASMRPIEPGGLVVDGERAGAFDGLPGFVEATCARPASSARRSPGASRTSASPGDPREWNDDETLLALASAGEDLPGDLVVGDESARRYYAWRAADVEAVARDARPRRYAALAEDAIRSVVPGPTVSGEQPKFGTVVATDAGPQHVLVKFSPSGYSPAARRWCDLLVGEHLALETLRAHGVPAVASEIVEGGSRVFLETVRFDRVGMYGRRAADGTATEPPRELAAFARFIDDTDATRRKPGPVHGHASDGLRAGRRRRAGTRVRAAAARARRRGRVEDGRRLGGRLLAARRRGRSRLRGVPDRSRARTRSPSRAALARFAWTLALRRPGIPASLRPQRSAAARLREASRIDRRPDATPRRACRPGASHRAAPSP